MNRSLLNELQQQHSYPSVTVLVNTTPATALSTGEHDTARRLIAEADQRLVGDVGDDIRRDVIEQLERLLEESTSDPSSAALALFASPEFSATVRLGKAVDERTTVDDTFTTRDLVADLNRTALYRVVTVSDRTCRVFVGDRQRLVEQRDDAWPLHRNHEHTPVTWARDVTARMRAEHGEDPLPTVIAGVQRSVRRFVPDRALVIGAIPGNHDRTSTVDLHHAAWPVVSDWLRTDSLRAVAGLDDARSADRYAGGIAEVWPLAQDGRIDTLVVEAGYAMAARVDEHGQVQPADDPHHPDVHDDIVDDAIETVLRHGGSAVIVADGTLAASERIAAVLRY